jgi:hypothetical protein
VKSFKLTCGHCGGDLKPVREGYDCEACGEYPSKIVQTIGFRKPTQEECEKLYEIIMGINSQ